MRSWRPKARLSGDMRSYHPSSIQAAHGRGGGLASVSAFRCIAAAAAASCTRRDRKCTLPNHSVLFATVPDTGERGSARWRQRGRSRACTYSRSFGPPPPTHADRRDRGVEFLGRPFFMPPAGPGPPQQWQGSAWTSDNSNGAKITAPARLLPLALLRGTATATLIHRKWSRRQAHAAVMRRPRAAPAC